MSSIEDAIRSIVREEIERMAPGLNRWLQSKTGEKAVNLSIVRSEAGKRAWVNGKREKMKLLVDMTIAEVREELSRFGVEYPVRHIRDPSVNPHWGRWYTYLNGHELSAVTGPDFIATVLAGLQISDGGRVAALAEHVYQLNVDAGNYEPRDSGARLPDIGL